MLKRILKKLKDKMKNILPTSILNIYRNFNKFQREFIRQSVIRMNIPKVRKNHEKALKIVRKKEIIKVAFIAINESAWKYEGVYRLMEKSPKYEPVVFVCPYLQHGEEIMNERMDKAYEYFVDEKYKVIKTLDDNTKEWYDIKNVFKPDIVFFSNPHKLTKDQYYITNFLDTLTCYVSYSFVVLNDWKLHYNEEAHNYFWKYFVETKYNVEYAKQFSVNKGVNSIFTGYPGVDKIIQKKNSSDPWKIKDRKIKRIIWAPHHTLGTHEEFSNFLRLSEFMLELLEQYKGIIQIAFKPHPLVKSRLYALNELTKNGTIQVGRCSLSELNLIKGWDKEKTDAYFKKWENSTNGMLCESSYIDLFLTSDAMIHDSVSFLAEYLFTEKPVMFVKRNEQIVDLFNSLGQQIFKHIYQGHDKIDITKFIEDIVINGNDYMKNDRIDFVKKELLSPDAKLASENIIAFLNKNFCVDLPNQQIT